MVAYIVQMRKRDTELTTLRSRVEELEKRLAGFAAFAGPDGEPRKIIGKHSYGVNPPMSFPLCKGETLILLAPAAAQSAKESQ